MLVYLHIPKTAGSSFRKVIEAAYPDGGHFGIYRTGGGETVEQIWSDNKDVVRKSKIVYGHIPAVIHNLHDGPVQYFTFLRHPVERVLSLYKYIKYDFPHHGLHKRIQAGLTFNEWITQYPIMANNVQTKMLAGYEEHKVRSKPWMLSIALARLEDMPVFGLTEHYNESVQRICREFHWPMPALVRENVSSKTNAEFIEQEAITEESLQRLRNQNSLDMQLYERAQRLFQERRGLLSRILRRLKAA